MTLLNRNFFLFVILFLFKLSALASTTLQSNCSKFFDKPITRAPWQMTLDEWLQNGSPDYSIDLFKKVWRSRESTESAPWELTREAEIKAINEFIDIFPDPLKSFRDGRGVNGEPDYVKSYRQKDFAARFAHHYVTHLPENNFHLEDAPVPMKIKKLFPKLFEKTNTFY